MKKRHILVISLPILAAAVLLIAIIIVAAVLFFKTFEKPQNVVYGGAFDPRTCIGEGCYYASSDKYGGVYCDGYSCDIGNMTVVCYNTLEEYCRGCKPQEDPRACACTYNNVSARYCSMDERCYANQAEFLVNCTSNPAAACAEMEARLRNASPADLEYGCDEAVASIRGLKEEECRNKTWAEIYASANEKIKSKIFHNVGLVGGLEPPRPNFDETCSGFCASCNSSLCTPNNLCEYARST